MGMLGEQPTQPVSAFGWWVGKTGSQLIQSLVPQMPKPPPKLNINLTYDNVKQVNPTTHDWSYPQTYKSGSAEIKAYEDRGFPRYDNNGQPTKEFANWNGFNWKDYPNRFEPPREKTATTHGARLDSLKERGLIQS